MAIYQLDILIVLLLGEKACSLHSSCNHFSATDEQVTGYFMTREMPI